MLPPPSTPSTCPVIKPASLLSRKVTAAATSAGAPKRPMGMDDRAFLAASLPSGWAERNTSVYMGPGNTALTGMPSGASFSGQALGREEWWEREGQAVQCSWSGEH